MLKHAAGTRSPIIRAQKREKSHVVLSNPVPTENLQGAPAVKTIESTDFTIYHPGPCLRGALPVLDEVLGYPGNSSMVTTIPPKPGSILPPPPCCRRQNVR